jgi:glycosyltransferase involved in cell wall biosynthesis
MNIGISIIIPNYNSGDYLFETIKSIQEQNIVFDYEIIIIDDNSSDDLTRQTLDSISDFSKITIIKNNQNIGVQKSRNKGVLAANYSIILPLDSDDKLLNNSNSNNQLYINKGIKVLLENEEVAFIHTLSMMFDKFEGLTISSYPLNEKMALRKHHIPTSIIYRKEDVIKTNLYDESILKWQDWSFGINILAERWRLGKKNKIHFIRGPYHGYRIHNYNSRVSNIKVSEEEMTFYVVKYYFEYFHFHYPELNTVKSITEHLINNKPSRLVDLLFVAQYDIDLAKDIVTSREGLLLSEYHDSLNIP